MLSVVFGKTAPVYHPDEILSGDVVVSTTTSCKILDVTVNFCGISTVSLVVSEGKEGSKRCEKIEEADIHLDVLDHLVRSYRGVDMDVGANTYAFSLWLPPHLPSSHISPFGNINYYIQVHLQTSAFTLDLRKPFYIVAPVNINVFYAFQNPRSAEVTKKYGLFNNKVLKLKASVSSTCFVPGERISVVVEVNNNTTKPLKYLFCTLKQITTVTVPIRDQAVSRVSKQCLKTEAHKVAGVGAVGGRHSWVCHVTTPPSLTPTIANSSLVLVTYSIQVSAKLSQVMIPPEVEIPIVFGERAPVLPQHLDARTIHTQTYRTRRISQLPQSICASSDNTQTQSYQNRRISQLPNPTICLSNDVVSETSPIHTSQTRRISQLPNSTTSLSNDVIPETTEINNSQMRRISQLPNSTIFPSDDNDVRALALNNSESAVSQRRRRYNSQPPLRPPAPMRRTSHHTHNAPSQRISITLQPAYEDAEKPELLQTDV